ncbi:MAG: dUTP diphosphatase [Spirochaetia bacterium]|nr:dUTP diphosphatase [Spirochaetia bacterium]
MQDQVSIKCFCQSPDFIPLYATEGSAGADLFAAVENDEMISPGERKLIPSGVRVEIPHGYEAQIRPRSGLAVKHGITLVNTPGTIDSDYRGEIKIIMINLGSEDFIVKRGDRIAQMIIAPVVKANFSNELSLTPTERGDGGFGSTGV